MSEWGNVSNQLSILEQTLTLKNAFDSTGVDMQAHDVAMQETADKLCGIGTKLAISMCRLRR